MVVKTSKKQALLISVLLVLGFIPIAFQGNGRILNILTLCLMWGVVASAWDLSIGYANVWSFGHIAFFTIGGYMLALMTRYLGVPPPVAILAGGSVAAIVGILIGLPCLRLTGVYVALVTFGIHLVLPTLITQARDYTGGYQGLSGFPPFQLGPYIFSSGAPVSSYYIILGISILLLFIIYRIINSPIGLAFVALRDSDGFATSLGINPYRYKLIVFGVSAFISGLMGAVYTSFYNTVSPLMLGVDTFLLVLIMLMLGGLGRFPGAVIGAFVITLASEFLRPLMLLRFVVLGAMVIGVMIFMPQGLMAIPERARPFIRRTFGRRHV
jgi:branched-chain amino acid transport system permease protein